MSQGSETPCGSGAQPGAETVSVRAVVRGRVQGVGFRDFVCSRARWLSLTGYARNLPDGRSVEVVAEGTRDALEQLIEYLQEGPRLGRVDAVKVEWGEGTGRHGRFGVAP